MEHSVVDWDDLSIDWSTFHAVVIRSTWDYHRRPQEFMDWLARISRVTALHNPLEIVRWNLDKRYLRDLVTSGMPVIPTEYVESSDDLDRVRLGPDVMVKPTISAGSNDTARFQDASGARAFAEAILRSGRAVMVQPYEAAIDERGETGLLFFAGSFSHAFCKSAIFRDGSATHNGLYVEEEISARAPTTEELRLGERVITMVEDRFGVTPLYARVDMVDSGEGTPTIMEVELIEPSLFLDVDVSSASRFADVLAGLG